MSHLAEVHYRQARGFLRAGDAARAVELLERARVLVRDDADLMARVLDDLTAAYSATGQHERAARSREQRERLTAAAAAVPTPPALPGAAAATHPGARSFAPLPAPGRRGTGAWVVPAIVAAALLLGIGGTLLVVRLTGGGGRGNDSAGPSDAALASTLPASAPSPAVATTTTRPAAAAAGGGAAPVTPATAPITRPAEAVAAPQGPDRQQLLKDNVGLVIVVLRYQGVVNRRQVTIDVPFGMGTAFAVHPTGVLLTNRHVLEPARPDEIPVTLEDAGMPTVTLRSTSYVVCFGPTAADRLPARLVHRSDRFDLAVLKVNRAFPTALTLASKLPRQGEDIYCCGFPGAVTTALNRAAATPRRVLDTTRKWQRTGQVDAFDEFSPDSFDSTLTRGIVSAPERNVRGVGYLQMDAAISPGNSGGPVLNANNEVLAIATFGLRNDALPTTNYNFALLLDQARQEIERAIAAR